MNLIADVNVSNDSPALGESVRVKVKPAASNINIFVDGAIGSTHYLQFTTATGPQSISVSAVDDQGNREDQSLDFNVSEPAEGMLYPHLGFRFSPYGYLSGQFRILNADALIGDHEHSWAWDFGDGHVDVTREPVAEHDFGDSLEPGNLWSVFHVTVCLLSEGKTITKARRSIAALNSYELMKTRSRILQPRSAVNRQGWIAGYSVNGQARLSNPEDFSIVYDTLTLEWRYKRDRDMNLPVGPREIEPISVPAGSTIETVVSFPDVQIPEDVWGFNLQLRGKLLGGDGYEAHTTLCFDLEPNRWWVETRQPVLDLVDQTRLVLAYDLTAPITLRDMHNAGQPDGIVPGPGALECIERGDLPVIPEPPVVDFCLPNYCPADRPVNVTCQLTDEERTIHIPGHVANARAGNVLLSPGGSGLIGGLLMQTTTPQWYSHSMIMVSDYYELRHSTMAEDRMANYPADRKMIDGKPVPSDGFRADILKYGWPGTVTQPIDDGFNGRRVRDPEVDGFNGPDRICYPIVAIRDAHFVTDRNGGWKLVQPLVVKPDPRLESADVRKGLNDVASAAAAIDGHYRFYAYTDATICEQGSATYDDHLAPPGGNGYWPNTAAAWAAGTQPTVCSSLVWASAHAAGRQIDLPANNVEVDGLRAYSTGERAAAGRWLHAAVESLIGGELGKKGLLGSVVGFLTDIEDDCADQLCNTFASDWAEPPSKDSNNWENPGAGIAVSPDNIMTWSPPVVDPHTGNTIGLYGYSEPVAYRPGEYETRKIAKLVPVTGTARARGRVLLDGRPVEGARVKIACQESITRDAYFDFAVPDGRYLCTATYYDVTGTKWVWEGQKDVTFPAGSTQEFDIELQPPPEQHRLVTVVGTVVVTDQHDIGKNDIGHFPIRLTARLMRDKTHQEFEDQWFAVGEVGFSLTGSVDWNPDFSVTAKLQAVMDADDEKHQSGIVDLVAEKDGEIPWHWRMADGGIFNLDDNNVVLDLTIKNERLP